MGECSAYNSPQEDSMGKLAAWPTNWRPPDADLLSHRWPKWTRAYCIVTHDKYHPGIIITIIFFGPPAQISRHQTLMIKFLKVGRKLTRSSCKYWHETASVLLSQCLCWNRCVVSLESPVMLVTRLLLLLYSYHILSTSMFLIRRESRLQGINLICLA